MTTQDIQDHFLMLVKGTCFFYNLEAHITVGTRADDNTPAVKVNLKRTPENDRRATKVFNHLSFALNDAAKPGGAVPRSSTDYQHSYDDYGDDIAGMHHYEEHVFEVHDESGQRVLTFQIVAEDYRVS